MTASLDILELDDWRSEDQLVELMEQQLRQQQQQQPHNASADAEGERASELSGSRWCGESLLLLGEDPEGALLSNAICSDANGDQLRNCAWYPCRMSPNLLNFYTCVKSQLYIKSDPSLLLRTRPVLVCVNDQAVVEELVRLVAKDATSLTVRPLIQASLELIQAFTCVYRRDEISGLVGLDNHSVTMLRADYDANGDLTGVRYDLLWLMGQGALCHRGCDFSAYRFFYSLMEHAKDAVRAEFRLDDPELATSMTYADASLVPDHLKRLNVVRCLSEVFHFSHECLDFVHRCASAALNLRLVRVLPDPRKPKKCVEFERSENLDKAARLLAIDAGDLRKEITVKFDVMRDGHRKVVRNRTADECNTALEGIVQAIYRRLAQFVVARVNEHLAGVLSSSVNSTAPTGRLTLLVGPTDPLRGFRHQPSGASHRNGDAFNFELNYLSDLMGSLRAQLTLGTPIRLLAEDGVQLSAEVLAKRGWPDTAGPPSALIDSYRSVGSVKVPTLLGVAFGIGGDDKTAAAAASAASAVFRLERVKRPLSQGKAKGQQEVDVILEVGHWLATCGYQRASLSPLAPSESEAASLFLARSAPLIRDQIQRLQQRQQLQTGPGRQRLAVNFVNTLASHSLTQLTALLTDPTLLDLSVGADADAVKLLFVERTPPLNNRRADVLLALRSCLLSAVKPCQLFQCVGNRHRMLAAFGEVALPYTAKELGACKSADGAECAEVCFKAGNYLKGVAKRLYDAPLLVGRKQLFCHYRHLLVLYRTRASLTRHAVVMQAYARGMLARRLFRGLRSEAAAYKAELSAAMRVPASGAGQDGFYKAVVRSLTADVWRANWSLIEAHMQASTGDGANLLPAGQWAELLAFSRGREIARVGLAEHSVVIRCGEGNGTDQVVLVDIPGIDASKLQIVHLEDAPSGVDCDLLVQCAEDRSVLLTRLAPGGPPAWCWGYWDPESVGCGRRAAQLGSDEYPVGEPVPVFDCREWVAHLCRKLQAAGGGGGECSVRKTRLRCATPLVIGDARVGLLADAPLWLLLVNHAELQRLAEVGGVLNAEVAEALTNYQRFGSLEPRRRWAKVHSNQAPMQISSLFTRLQMLDPVHRAADEAARLRLLSNDRDQSACDSSGRRIQWAKQRAKETGIN